MRCCWARPRCVPLVAGGGHWSQVWLGREDPQTVGVTCIFIFSLLFIVSGPALIAGLCSRFFFGFFTGVTGVFAFFSPTHLSDASFALVG